MGRKKEPLIFDLLEGDICNVDVSKITEVAEFQPDVFVEHPEKMERAFQNGFALLILSNVSEDVKKAVIEKYCYTISYKIMGDKHPETTSDAFKHFSKLITHDYMKVTDAFQVVKNVHYQEYLKKKLAKMSPEARGRYESDKAWFDRCATRFNSKE